MAKGIILHSEGYPTWA